jgi:Lhr-like helicase
VTSGGPISEYPPLMAPLEGFHPAVSTWFARRFVYVSPLKALAVDIHQNLEGPLAEIAREAEALGLAVPPITVAVRTGDTTAGARAAMVKDPPTFLVTTPESLYLLVTAERSRAALGQVETDHRGRDPRPGPGQAGIHLALTLERLEHLQAGARPQRIGLSATQRPIEQTARLLSGVGPDGRRPSSTAATRGSTSPSSSPGPSSRPWPPPSSSARSSTGSPSTSGPTGPPSSS